MAARTALLLATLLLHAEALAGPEAVTCDEPSPAACPRASAPFAQLLPVPPPPPFRLRVSLSVVSGIGAYALLFGGASPVTAHLGGEVRLVWHKPGGATGLGLRLGASSTLDDERVRTLGFDTGFVFTAAWFWLSSGVGVMHVQPLESGSSSTYPDLSLALGVDFPLGDHVALRLYSQAAGLIFSGRLNTGGGVVVRF